MLYFLLLLLALFIRHVCVKCTLACIIVENECVSKEMNEG